MAGSSLLGCRQCLKLLQYGNGGGAVSTDLDDTIGRWYLQDQVPIVDNSHELVQDWPVEDGIEGEVDQRNVEDNTLRVIVIRHPKSHREGDATARDDRAQTHSRERV
jgi:hypothetical protein